MASAVDNRAPLAELISLLQAQQASGARKTVVFAGAAVSIHQPSNLPTASQLIQETVDFLLREPVLAFSRPAVERIRDALVSKHQEGTVPLEAFYDAIEQIVGARMFAGLSCLQSKLANENHRMIAALLEQGYLDCVITTNFDTLIESCLRKRWAVFPSSSHGRIWKIHGSIDAPDSVSATLQRIGQRAFDEALLERLRHTLEDRAVLFIGYAGADPDLLPALSTARMSTAIWCVLSASEIEDKKKQPLWRALDRAGVTVKWLVGDLQSQVLVPVRDHLKLAMHVETSSVGGTANTCQGPSPLQASLERWDANQQSRLSDVERSRILLRILYYLTKVRPDEEAKSFCKLLVEGASTLLGNRNVGRAEEEAVRDLRVLLAEGYILLHEFNKALVALSEMPPGFVKDMAQARLLVNLGVINLIAINNPVPRNISTKLQSAEKYFLTALRIARSNRTSARWSELRASCAANLAFLCFEMGRDREGFKRFEEAEEAFIEAGDYYGLIGACINMVNLCSRRPARPILGDNYREKANRYLRAFPNPHQNASLARLTPQDRR